MQTSQDPSPVVESVETSSAESTLDTVSARVSDAGQRVKPVAAAAENVVVQTAHAAEVVVAHTVHLSARGLNRVDAYLSERRERRQNESAVNDVIDSGLNRGEESIDSATDSLDADGIKAD